MRRFESWKLSVITDRDQFLLQQCHHIHRICLRVETEIDSAYMCSKCKGYFMGIFTFPMSDYSMSNKKFGGIISDKFRPYFLFYKVRPGHLVCELLCRSANDASYTCPMEKTVDL